MASTGDVFNIWVQSEAGPAGRGRGPPLPPLPPPQQTPPPPPPPSSTPPSSPSIPIASAEFIKFYSRIVRQEGDLGEIIRKELSERWVTYDVIRREFVYRDDTDGINCKITIPCSDGCTEIRGDRHIFVRLIKNRMKNLNVQFFLTNGSEFRELAAAVKRNETIAYKRTRWDVPSRTPVKSVGGGPASPQCLTSRDEPHISITGSDTSFLQTALVPYSGVPQLQKFVKAADSPTTPKTKRRSDAPHVKEKMPKEEKAKHGATKSPSSAAGSSSAQFLLGTRVQSDRQKMKFYCSWKPTCKKKETKYTTDIAGEIMHVCMQCKNIMKLGTLGKFQCCTNKCADAVLEELTGQSALVYRCNICNRSMTQVV